MLVVDNFVNHIIKLYLQACYRHLSCKSSSLEIYFPLSSWAHFGIKLVARNSFSPLNNKIKIAFSKKILPFVVNFLLIVAKAILAKYITSLNFIADVPWVYLVLIFRIMKLCRSILISVCLMALNFYHKLFVTFNNNDTNINNFFSGEVFRQ